MERNLPTKKFIKVSSLKYEINKSKFKAKAREDPITTKFKENEKKSEVQIPENSSSDNNFKSRNTEASPAKQ